MARRLIAPLAFGIGGLAILLALGFWQLERLEWKRGLLDQIAARMEAAPAPVPAAPNAAEHKYLRVAAEGELLPSELHVYTALPPPANVGYRIVAPMALEDGRRILIDRGVVPEPAKDEPRPTGPIRVEGMLLWPDETDRFTAAPDRDANLWFARDVPAMAAALGTEPVMLAVAASEGPAAAGAPTPLQVGVNIRNPHLEYAVTWFGLAVVWALMTAYLLWRITRRTL